MSNLEKAERLLSEAELDAYRKYVESGKPALSPTTAAQFYALFLQGYSTSEILKHHPALGLGIIVRARIDYDWDFQRDEYVRQLMTGVQATVQKSTLEAIQFASDGMAVFHRLAGKRFKEFLQTGDEKVLGDWKDLSFRTYKDFVEMLMRLTGQDDKKVSGTVRHVVETPQGVDVIPQDRPITSAEAASLLKLVGGKNEP